MSVLLTIPITLLLAYVSWRLVERPALEFKLDSPQRQHAQRNM